MSSPDFSFPYPALCPARYPACVPPPSTRDTHPGSRPGHIPGSILLKKKGESIAIALPTSFGGTHKPRAPFMAQSGGAR